MFSHSFSVVVNDTFRFLRGSLRGRTFPTHLSQPAPLIPVWLVSHGQDRCIDAWHAEWIFDVFDARTLRFEPALRTRAYAPDRLLSLHVMDRSIYCDFARDIYRFSCDSSLRQRDGRA